MQTEKEAKALIKKLDKLLRRKMGPIFNRYGQELDDLITPLKWKPLVLVIGNYSSGKSTFINEFLGTPIQRTGQAPTDDSFTILTTPDEGESEKEVPGSTLVNDERLPFGSLKRFGETLISHLQMKQIEVPALENIAVIDTPGMLDSVTEKDRGYDYLGVVGELSRLADLIILMFDPHKAGTIKETYQAIRSTLPGSTGEDRVVYVLNRVDECDNVTDLVRSYGTLCWNLSQMTGGKDMPRIFLTYASTGDIVYDENVFPQQEDICEVWGSERQELKEAVKTAPKLRMNHILEEVDRSIRELSLQVEALESFRKGFRTKMQGLLRGGTVFAVLAFLFGDLAGNYLTGFPEKTLIGGLLNGSFSTELLIWPAAAGLLVLLVLFALIQQVLFPRHVKKTIENLDTLLPLETAYKRDLWDRVAGQVSKRISGQGYRQLWVNNKRYLKRMDHFLEKELRQFFEKVKSS